MTIQVNDNAATNLNTTSSTATNSTTLSKNDFLQLLVAQLTHQDPTSPMNTSDFMTQMAELTSVEQTQNMSDAINTLVSDQQQTSLSTQAAMIGKTITYTVTSTDASGNASSSTASGVVKAVTLNNGTVDYLTSDGTSVDPSTITQIQSN
ncbi:MAG: flagellar hook capping FlgD N-terminal domain-containing protein [Sporolactobacillus sp.]